MWFATTGYGIKMVGFLSINRNITFFLVLILTTCTCKAIRTHHPHWHSRTELKTWFSSPVFSFCSQKRPPLFSFPNMLFISSLFPKTGAVSQLTPAECQIPKLPISIFIPCRRNSNFIRCYYHCAVYLSLSVSLQWSLLRLWFPISSIVRPLASTTDCHFAMKEISGWLVYSSYVPNHNLLFTNSNFSTLPLLVLITSYQIYLRQPTTLLSTHFDTEFHPPGTTFITLWSTIVFHF